jgi:hypothetical protein
MDLGGGFEVRGSGKHGGLDKERDIWGMCGKSAPAHTIARN